MMRSAALLFTASFFSIGFGLNFGSAAAQDALRIATPLIVPDFANPYQGLSLPATVATLAAFDPLVVVDGAGKPQPWLAESWSSPDGKVWTVKLREGIKFSNGAPLTSDAVVASVEHMHSDKGRTETVGSSLANIERAVAVSPLVAEVHLKKAEALFAFRMSQWKIPEPNDWRRQVEAGPERRGIGTGPYMLVGGSAARMSFATNPYAWNTPKTAKLDVIQLPDQPARMRGIAAGSVDMAMQIGASDREELESLKGQVLTRRGMRITYLSFITEAESNKASPVQNQKVRLALNYAVDRDKITGVLLEGLAKPSSQLLLPGAPGHVADLKSFPYDPAKARALLAEAGYPNGIKLTLRAGIVGADQGAIYQQVAQDMRAAGIALTIRPAALAEMTQMMFEGRFDADLFTNIARGLDALGDYRYRSCLGQTGNNKAYFCDAQTLDLIKKAQNSIDMADVDGLLQQVTRRENENPPGVYLWQESFMDGAGPRVASAPDYSSYYDFLPLHLISVKK
ncbi:MAG: ABC transporter substrate-binding protein [Rhodospirillaceae bacterium]|nr:ABC transporter substrate-binding protein [Rhodospirillaceae bacterium]